MPSHQTPDETVLVVPCLKERNSAFLLKARDLTAIWGAKTGYGEVHVRTNSSSYYFVPWKLLFFFCRGWGLVPTEAS